MFKKYTVNLKKWWHPWQPVFRLRIRFTYMDPDPA